MIAYRWGAIGAMLALIGCQAIDAAYKISKIGDDKSMRREPNPSSGGGGGSSYYCPRTTCDGGRCERTCEGECQADCAGTNNCDFQCGEDSNFMCQSSGICNVTAGPNSVINCNKGTCEVECEGDCTVNCLVGDRCHVDCPDGAACKINRPWVPDAGRSDAASDARDD